MDGYKREHMGFCHNEIESLCVLLYFRTPKKSTKHDLNPVPHDNVCKLYDPRKPWTRNEHSLTEYNYQLNLSVVFIYRLMVKVRKVREKSA